MTGSQELTFTIEALRESISQLDKRLAQVEARAPGKIRTEHPHIVRVQGVCGGRPVIEGTRISVKTIVGWARMGMTPSEIVIEYPFISLAQVADALAYYERHSEEIEAEFAEEQRLLEREIPRLQELVASSR